MYFDSVRDCYEDKSDMFLLLGNYNYYVYFDSVRDCYEGKSDMLFLLGNYICPQTLRQRGTIGMGIIRPSVCLSQISFRMITCEQKLD